MFLKSNLPSKPPIQEANVINSFARGGCTSICTSLKSAKVVQEVRGKEEGVDEFGVRWRTHEEQTFGVFGGESSKVHLVKAVQTVKMIFASVLQDAHDTAWPIYAP